MPTCGVCRKTKTRDQFPRNTTATCKACSGGRSSAQTAAKRRLARNHKDEYNSLYKEELRKRGLPDPKGSRRRK